jgi:hypothetical protein
MTRHRRRGLAARLLMSRTPQTPPDRSGRDEPEGTDMTNVDVILKDAVNIDGAVAALLVDYQSGMALGQAGDATVMNLDVAAAGNTDVVRAKMRTMESLGLNDSIDDILITLGKAYHLINLPKSHPGLFIYLVLDKDKANLAMARHKLASLSNQLEI